MDRIDGPTMLEDLGSRPWTMPRRAHSLARLSSDLAKLGAPSWLPGSYRVPRGDAVVHLDLHPANVIMGSEGPFVIDWTNARRGLGPFDAALSYVLMATGEADINPVVLFARKLLLATFALARGRDAVREHLVEACDYRLGDANLTAAEIEATNQLRGLHDTSRSRLRPCN